MSDYLFQYLQHYTWRMGHSGQVGGSLQLPDNLCLIVPPFSSSASLHSHHQREKYIHTSMVVFVLVLLAFQTYRLVSILPCSDHKAGHMQPLTEGCQSTDTLSQTCITREALEDHHGITRATAKTQNMTRRAQGWVEGKTEHQSPKLERICGL